MPFDETFLAGVTRSQLQTVTQILDITPDLSEGVKRVVEDGAEWFDRLRKKLGGWEKVSCRVGCHWCCRQRVALSPPEAFVIAWYLDAMNLPAGLKRSLADDWDARWKGEDRLSSPERFSTGLPCPFLSMEYGGCLIHAVRPLACRWYESFDELACQRGAMENTVEMRIPYDPRVRQLADAVAAGMNQAFSQRGLAMETLVLSGAMVLLREGADVFNVWKNGSDPLASAWLKTLSIKI